MKYKLEGYDINGQTIFIDTEKLGENMGEIAYDLSIDNKVCTFKISFKDIEVSEDNCKVQIFIENNEHNISYSEDVDMSVLGIALFNSIKNFIEFKQEEKIQGIISKSIGNATKELAKHKIIEGIYYEGLTVIYDEDKNIIGTATSFKVVKNKIQVVGVDFNEFKENVTLVKYEDDREIVIKCLTRESYDSMTLNSIEIVERSDDLPDIKQLRDFNGDNEEFLIYRRGLLIRESSILNFIDEDEFADF